MEQLSYLGGCLGVEKLNENMLSDIRKNVKTKWRARMDALMAMVMWNGFSRDKKSSTELSPRPAPDILCDFVRTI